MEHTVQEDFEHFLSYSGLSGESQETIAKLRRVYDADREREAALLAAGNAMADELRSCQRALGVLEKRTAVLKMWEQVTK